jgi:uncharacterized membrane protein YfcA
MSDYLLFAGIFLSGILSSYLWMYITGGISSLSILCLLGLWVPPSIANSTYQIGNLFSNLGGIKYFIQSQNYQRNQVIPMFLIMLVGGYIWSLFIINLNKEIVFKILWGIYLILWIYEIFNRYNKNISIEIPHAKNIRIWYILIWITSLWSAIFPAGNGVFYYQIYRRFFGMTPLMAKWHQKLVINGLFLWVLPNMFIHGIFNLWYIVLFGIGMYIWGTQWAKHVIKAGNNILQTTIIIGMLVAGLYFLFWK